MSEVRALLLAAGLGTRLHPLTEHWPKCLMPVGERPLLEYWLETLWRAGMREALVNLHYLPEIVECFLARKPSACGLIISVTYPLSRFDIFYLFIFYYYYFFFIF